MALVNSGFELLHKKFISRGWELKENKSEAIVYIDPINENDRFSININQNNISVSVPISNSNIQYKTILNNYFDASEYLEMHLDHFMKTENRFL